jgi:hypothetical protein
MLKSILGMRTEMLKPAAEKRSDIVVASPVEKLPARSVVISPQPRPLHLSALVSKMDAGVPLEIDVLCQMKM